ncbi:MULTISPECIES: preprotein translocase subunit SecA [Prochlorococcus]|uniref:Protein translocase subunit SecA n=1 Tax=Prochlorococcus marinus (strain SARG / CCMP1375 / SS120) TaxID=167539 RepID=SECA_PROMA|nr:MULTISPECIES: preprotein translocase subunit SecA [Prochlorococcus]Q7V9M9.1 RecName: Full=Protein translocase subunit SecA [Prochlorococcus marinus subsp. marinus str. CCMP1375]AAQ00845.1 Preprotein translocase subunit SecA [Prochlorococcus marinus subsp. marinus str. CCMP1375]KGG10659.1 Protein export cytoplasm protein SecA ATPase RNA helicase [Prochlorococcus marinus str. LG]KGG21246.1 Protein export cytoplasm protein SecA ATPase RNA helicase [Prochlorococcus marinus str. SS2]KGG23906.1 P
MLKLLLGDPNARKLKRYQPILTDINLFEDEIASLNDDELRGKTSDFRTRLDKSSDSSIQECLDDLLPEAFAVVREASKRVLGMRHFDVQLIGGMVLHEGQIAEMKTGEGKTLVATLPSFLNALTGRGVHIVTVNDYLARRDAEWMGQVHRFLGLSVGLIQQDMTPIERRKNYECDITYATNSELGFDYLRDNMANDINEIVQRDFQFCIIDEVDSILIDEARTPLIISGQIERPQEKYQKAAEVVSTLQRAAEMGKDGIDPEGDYEVDEKQRTCTLTDEGFAKSEELLKVKDLFDPKDPWAHYITNALKAKELFVKDVNYIVRNEDAVIVDEFTGRVMPGRRWSDGQHQAIEAKEELPIQPETQTLASITYQNFFLLYPRLAGMTGTAKTEEVEFEKTYKLETTVIPTNRPRSRADWVDQVFKTESAKWRAVANETVEIHKKGRPVLVGTTSVEKSEVLSALLGEQDVPHNLLNAKPENVEREAEIIAQAGRAGAVTIATNMAGRGTDIILGGNSDYMARLKVREVLFPKLVKPEDSHKPPVPLQRRKDSSVGFGKEENNSKDKKVNHSNDVRAQENLYPCVLTDSTEQVLLDLEHQLIKEWGDRVLSPIELEDRISTAAEKAPTQDPLVQSLREAISLVKSEYDVVVKQEEVHVREAGGLHVIGTERHESRRVDNQLRGRAGRQGDLGSTRFFLSLGDNLLRIFGGDRVAALMNAFRVDEDMPIESGMLTRSLESAQKKVETYYFDIRKQVFEYDEVMNNQRRAVYSERHRVLEGDELKKQVIGYGERTMQEIVYAYVNPELPSEEWDLKQLVGKVKEFVYLLDDLKPKDIEALNIDELQAFLQEQLRNAYDLKESQIEESRPGLMREAERFFILQQIDTLWREHLQSMDALRESVGLRGYGQKDPLIEYKNEGYDMFLEMMTNMRRNVIYSMFMFQPAPPSDKE